MPAPLFNDYGLKIAAGVESGRTLYRYRSDRNPDGNKDIAYRFNKSCMRNDIEIEDIDFSNYLLAAGCSFTEGVGINIEDTYWYKLGSYLKMQSYSIGVSGLGNDSIVYQINTWLARFPAPKILLLQLTNYDRVFSLSQRTTLMPSTLNTQMSTRYFLSRLDNKGNVWDMMQHLKWIEALKTLLPNTRIFSVGIKFTDDGNNYPLEDFAFDAWMKSGFAPARDGHHGPDAHLDLAQTLYSQIQ